MPLEDVPKSAVDYNTIAKELYYGHGVAPFYIMSWLDGLRGETFCNFLDSTGLLDDYRQSIPELFLRRRNSATTGFYNGIQFTEVMDKTLVWISQHISQLVAVHQLDDSANINHGPDDMTRWICDKWLQYQIRYHVHEIESGQETAGGSTDQQAHDLGPEPRPKTDAAPPDR
jgi:hypothetical protein